MVDAQGNLVWRHLRRIDETLAAAALSAVKRDIASLKLDFAGMQPLMDGFDRRLERIEKRLELAEV